MQTRCDELEKVLDKTAKDKTELSGKVYDYKEECQQLKTQIESIGKIKDECERKINELEKKVMDLVEENKLLNLARIASETKYSEIKLALKTNTKELE